MNFDLQTLQLQFQEHAISMTSTPLVLALSGGLDSTVLLHALHQAKAKVRCVHINHGLSPDASQWADHCRAQAEDLGVPVEIHTVDIEADDNLEERCREARYQVLKENLRTGEYLLTAHHQDDQMETVLLQLIRGAGVRGLQAMATVPVNFGKGVMFRPLLAISRKQLLEYALDHSLNWVDDTSNAGDHFDRNYLRHHVTPALERRWPAVAATVSRTAQCMHDAQVLLDELAETDVVTGHKGRSLEFANLGSRHELRVANAIRYWLRTLGVRTPPRVRLLEAVRQFLHSADDKSPALTWEDGGVQRYRQQLYFFPPLQFPDREVRLPVKFSEHSALSELPDIKFVRDDSGGLNLSRYGDVQISYRQGGERLLRADGHHTLLKHWFQEQGVPPFMRDFVPLVFADQQLIAVAGSWHSPDAKCQSGNSGWRLAWDHYLVEFMPKD